MLKTQLKLHGKFIAKLYDHTHCCRGEDENDDCKKGVLVQVQESENLVVTSGKEFYANLIGNGGSVIGDGAINFLAVVTDASSPSLTDTQLVAEIDRSVKEEPPSIIDTTASIDFIFGATEAIGNLKEVGCFINGTDVPNSGVLFDRANIDVNKTILNTLTITLVVTVV